MPTTYYYCCECNDGPYNAANNAACAIQSCQHKFCSGCNSETVDALDSSPESEDAQSEHADAAHQYTTASTAIYPALGTDVSAYTSTTTHTMLTTTGVQLLTSFSPDVPSHSMPLTFANLAGFDAGVTGYAYGDGDIPINSLAKEKVEYRWYCCACGYGPNSKKLDASCANCSNHWKCGYCRVEEIRRK